MNRALILGLVVTTSSLLGGCATTGDTVGGPLARCDGQRQVVSRDVDRSASVAQRIDVTTTVAGPREGTPTPEPAMPAPDNRLAGPTPQVPIPAVSVASSRW